MIKSSGFEVHKFGGSSLASADCFLKVRDIVLERATETRLAIVLSASGTTTDQLVQTIQDAIQRPGTPNHELERIRTVHDGLLDRLRPHGNLNPLTQQIEADLVEIAALLQTISKARAASPELTALVLGFGELWSSQIFLALLASHHSSVGWINSRDFLTVQLHREEPRVDWPTTQRNFERAKEQLTFITVLPGFVAQLDSGVPSTLGRNGSDFTASIVGSLLEAQSITIWTNVNGIFSADPSRVPDAKALKRLSFAEARELAYFGASVLHPRTLDPAIKAGIPVFVRNTFDLNHPGTQVCPTPQLDEGQASQKSVRGFSTMDHVSLLNLEGSGLAGIPGVAQRVFAALHISGVSAILISQGGSESSICLAVRSDEAAAACQTIEDAFAPERHRGSVEKVQVISECSIIAAVGDEMVNRPGVAGRFFSGLARAGVNVLAIAQGSSERNISAVIPTAESTRALRAVHAAFYLSKRTLSVGLIGAGNIGREFLAQLQSQNDFLQAHFAIEVRLRGISNSRHMLLKNDIDLNTWDIDFNRASTPCDLNAFVEHVHSATIPYSLIVDCTASDETAAEYSSWLNQGIHIITPNKKANTRSMEYYRELREDRKPLTSYYYEATVGAGLPVISTLQDLIRTGDRIHKIEGVFSGTLSFLLNNFLPGKKFSEILIEARALGYTEPDPREDLSGMDVARKLVTLGREMGLSLEVVDVDVEGLVPESLDKCPDAQSFMQALGDFDHEWDARRQSAEDRGEKLRYIGRVSEDGRATVKLESLPKDHPFAQIGGSENIFAFHTLRYQNTPLLVRGPGAGPQVTAAGVFGDLLRVVSQLGREL